MGKWGGESSRPAGSGHLHLASPASSPPGPAALLPSWGEAGRPGREGQHGWDFLWALHPASLGLGCCGARLSGSGPGQGGTQGSFSGNFSTGGQAQEWPFFAHRWMTVGLTLEEMKCQPGVSWALGAGLAASWQLPGVLRDQTCLDCLISNVSEAGAGRELSGLWPGPSGPGFHPQHLKHKASKQKGQ